MQKILVPLAVLLISSSALADEGRKKLLAPCATQLPAEVAEGEIRVYGQMFAAVDLMCPLFLFPLEDIDTAMSIRKTGVFYSFEYPPAEGENIYQMTLAKLPNSDDTFEIKQINHTDYSNNADSYEMLIQTHEGNLSALIENGE